MKAEDPRLAAFGALLIVIGIVILVGFIFLIHGLDSDTPVNILCWPFETLVLIVLGLWYLYLGLFRKFNPNRRNKKM